jgi:hypothetical protein
MILFVQNEQGQYTPATSEMIIKEGRCRTRDALKKGTDYIGSTEDAKEAISTCNASVEIGEFVVLS